MKHQAPDTFAIARIKSGYTRETYEAAHSCVTWQEIVALQQEIIVTHLMKIGLEVVFQDTGADDASQT
jgi:hypothetical protein